MKNTYRLKHVIKKATAHFASGLGKIQAVLLRFLKLKVNLTRKNILIIAFFAVLILITALTDVIIRQYYSPVPDSILKIAFVTDWEYSSRDKVGKKLTGQALEQMDIVTKEINEKFHPDMLVSGGDMIESSGFREEKAITYLTRINDLFSKVQSEKKEYVMGNHDLRALSKDKVREILGMADNHSFYDYGDWRFVFMDANFNPETEAHRGPNQYNVGYVSKSEFQWLEEALKTDRPTIIFSHFSALPSSKNLTNHSQTRAFLEKFPNLVAMISGHDPDFKFRHINGINYFIVDNLVNPNALGSYATIETSFNQKTKEARISLVQHGENKQIAQAKKAFPTTWQEIMKHTPIFHQISGMKDRLGSFFKY